MQRDALYYRLMIAAPGMKFAFWPYELNEADGTMVNPGYEAENIKLIDTWCVYWDPNNTEEAPRLADLNAITDQQIADYREAERKAARNAEKAQDMAVVGAYATAKAANPTLTFSEYLDQIEAIQIDLGV